MYPKFILASDIFEKVKKPVVLEIPSNVNVSYQGKGSDLLSLQVAENAVFNAPQAKANTVRNSGKVIMQKIKALFTYKHGKSQAYDVHKNVEKDYAITDIQNVDKNYMFDHSQAAIDTVDENSEFGEAKLLAFKVNTSKMHDKSKLQAAEAAHYYLEDEAVANIDGHLHHA